MAETDPPSKPLESVDLPVDLAAWLKEKHAEKPSRLCDDDVLEVLVAARLNAPNKWVDALEVLKDVKLISVVRPVVDRLYREEMTERLGKKQRRQVQTDESNFTVTTVWIYDSDDPVYEMEIAMGGKAYKFAFTDDDMDTARRWKKAFRRATKRQPRGLPTGGQEWEAIVEMWLNKAHIAGTVVPMPDEASEAGQVRDLIREILWDRMVGDSVEDFEAGRLVAHPTKEGHFAVKGSKLRAEVHKRHRERGGGRIPPQLLAHLCRGLGCDLDDRPRVDGRQVRAYSFPWALGAPAPPPIPGLLKAGGPGAPKQSSLIVN